MSQEVERVGAMSQSSGERPHPTPITYFKIALLLSGITAVEVGIFYIEFLQPVIVTMFFVLSAVKFVLVVLFYMHLKFDHRLFSVLFVGGLLLAVSVTLALLALFRALTA